MIIKAQQKNLPITPKKLQLVANAIKHLTPLEAVKVLELYNKKSAHIMAKTIKQAIANATNNSNLSADSLKFDQILMGRGLALKRFHAGARGRAKPYEKIKSNLTVLLKSTQPTVAAAPKKALAKVIEPIEATQAKKPAAKKAVTKVTKTTKKTK